MRRQPNMELVLDALEQLSNRETQELLWLSTGTNAVEVSSPEEAICALFDDSGLGDALDWGELQRKGGRDVQDMPVFAPGIDDRFKALGTLLSKLPSGPPDRVIESHVMQEIRSAAARLLSDLEEVRASERATGRDQT